VSWEILTPAQQAVARPFIEARERERKHLVVYLSGAHAYGFPSPDSDLDLKCIHIAPTRVLVGLTPPGDPGDRIEVIDGVELDYGSNELGGVLRGVSKGNGNFLERILGALALGGDLELLAQARAVVQPLLSRRVAYHYRGFAASQLHAFDEKPTAKRALYVLRTTATGRQLLAHGTLITDVALLGEWLPPEIDELLAIKRTGEKEPLDAAQAETWRARLGQAIAAIDPSTSKLPEAPPEPAMAALDAWLQEVRRACW
jgi:predicted nucleotidyltransferase